MNPRRISTRYSFPLLHSTAWFEDACRIGDWASIQRLHDADTGKVSACVTVYHAASGHAIRSSIPLRGALGKDTRVFGKEITVCAQSLYNAVCGSKCFSGSALAAQRPHKHATVHLDELHKTVTVGAAWGDAVYTVIIPHKDEYAQRLVRCTLNPCKLEATLMPHATVHDVYKKYEKHGAAVGVKHSGDRTVAHVYDCTRSTTAVIAAPHDDAAMFVPAHFLGVVKGYDTFYRVTPHPTRPQAKCVILTCTQSSTQSADNVINLGFFEHSDSVHDARSDDGECQGGAVGTPADPFFVLRRAQDAAAVAERAAEQARSAVDTLRSMWQ